MLTEEEKLWYKLCGISPEHLSLYFSTHNGNPLSILCINKDEITTHYGGIKKVFITPLFTLNVSIVALLVNSHNKDKFNTITGFINELRGYLECDPNMLKEKIDKRITDGFMVDLQELEPYERIYPLCDQNFSIDQYRKKLKNI